MVPTPITWRRSCVPRCEDSIGRSLRSPGLIAPRRLFMPSDPAARVGPGKLHSSTEPLSVSRQAPNPCVVGCMAAALAVVASLVSEPNLTGIVGAALAVVAVTIAVIDWRHFIIPDWLNCTGFGLALIHAALGDRDAVVSMMSA